MGRSPGSEQEPVLSGKGGGSSSWPRREETHLSTLDLLRLHRQITESPFLQQPPFPAERRRSTTRSRRPWTTRDPGWMVLPDGFHDHDHSFLWEEA